MMLPTSSANCGVRVIGPSENGTLSSSATTTASTICCHRRGASVSGSLNMKPAKKTAGEDRKTYWSAPSTVSPTTRK